MPKERESMNLFYMNSRIYFKLTPKGEKIWDNENEEWNKNHPAMNRNIPYIGGDWVGEMLWIVFKIFGKHISAGSDVFIYDITTEYPLDL